MGTDSPASTTSRDRAEEPRRARSEQTDGLEEARGFRATDKVNAGTTATARPNWEQTFESAVQDVAGLNAISDAVKKGGNPNGLINIEGRTINAPQARAALQDSMDAKFQLAFAQAMTAHEGTGAAIFNSASKVERYGEKLGQLGQELARDPELAKLGIGTRNLSPSEIQNIIINRKLVQDPGSPGAINDETNRKLTQYLTLSEMRNVTQQQGDAAQGQNKGAMLVALAYANALLEHGAGFQDTRSGKELKGLTQVRDENGKPTQQVMLASDILKMVTDADMKIVGRDTMAAAQRTEAQSLMQVADRDPKAARDPINLMLEADRTKNPALFKDAYEASLSQDWDPQRAREAMKQFQPGSLEYRKQELISQTRANAGALYAASLAESDKPDDAKSLKLLKEATDNDPQVLKRLQMENVPDAIRARVAGQEFAAKHKEIGAILNNPDFMKAVNGAGEASAKATELSKVGPDGKERSESDLKQARELMIQATDKAQVAAQYLKPHQKEIDGKFEELSKKAKENKLTDAEKAEFGMYSKLYNTLHMETVARTELGALYTRTGDGIAGRAQLDRAMEDKHFFDNNEQARKTVESMQAETQERINAQAPWWSRYGRVLGPAGGTLVGLGILATAPVSLPALAVGAIAAGAATGVGMIAGGYLESKGGVSRDFGEGVKHSALNASIAGLTLGAGAIFQSVKLGGVVAGEAATGATAGEAATATSAAVRTGLMARAGDLMSKSAAAFTPANQIGTFARIGASESWLPAAIQGTRYAPYAAWAGGNAARYGTIAGISGLPMFAQNQSFGENARDYTQWVGSATALGVIGPTREASGIIGTIRAYAPSVAVAVGLDGAKNAGMELVAPYSTSRNYWDRVGSATWGDFDATQNGMMLMGPARLYYPWAAKIRRDTDNAMQEAADRERQRKAQVPPK